MRKRIADYWREQVWAAVMDQVPPKQLKPFKVPVEITITCYFKNRALVLDPDNICAKIAIDGLKGLLIADDTHRQVNCVSLSSVTDQSLPHPRTEIRLRPAL